MHPHTINHHGAHVGWLEFAIEGRKLPTPTDERLLSVTEHSQPPQFCGTGNRSNHGGAHPVSWVVGLVGDKKKKRVRGWPWEDDGSRQRQQQEGLRAEQRGELELEEAGVRRLAAGSRFAPSTAARTTVDEPHYYYYFDSSDGAAAASPTAARVSACMCVGGLGQGHATVSEGGGGRKTEAEGRQRCIKSGLTHPVRRPSPPLLLRPTLYHTHYSLLLPHHRGTAAPATTTYPPRHLHLHLQRSSAIIMPVAASAAGRSSPTRLGGSPAGKGPLTDFALLSGEKLRLCVSMCMCVLCMCTRACMHGE
jgi:hypothetical protein